MSKRRIVSSSPNTAAFVARVRRRDSRVCRRGGNKQTEKSWKITVYSVISFSRETDN
jgi:hypothetical protein